MRLIIKTKSRILVLLQFRLFSKRKKCFVCLIMKTLMQIVKLCMELARNIKQNIYFKWSLCLNPELEGFFYCIKVNKLKFTPLINLSWVYFIYLNISFPKMLLWYATRIPDYNITEHFIIRLVSSLMSKCTCKINLLCIIWTVCTLAHSPGQF